MKPPEKPLIPLGWPFPVPDKATYLRMQKEARKARKALLDKIPPSPL